MIKFYSVLPDLTKDFPVKRATIKNWHWYKRMVDDLKSQDPCPVMHTARCPGILDICNHGWIQYTYQDFTVETIGDGTSFIWSSDIDQMALEPFGQLLGPYLEFHPPHHLMDFNQFRVQSLRSLLKIQSPWFVQIPDNHSLLALPLPYADDCVFSAAPGIMRGTSSMNVQLFWHNFHGRVSVPRGTPLCQYFLMPDIDESFDVVDATVDVWNEIRQDMLHDMKRRYGDAVAMREIKPVDQ